MSLQDGALTVYRVGELTVVGFGGQDAHDQLNLADCREELVNLIKKHNCQTLAFDLTGVKLIPSGTLGLIASMKKMDVNVHIYNPSEDVVEVLEITKLDQILPIHYVEISEYDDR